jgi:hypothetical protein
MSSLLLLQQGSLLGFKQRHYSSQLENTNKNRTLRCAIHLPCSRAMLGVASPWRNEKKPSPMKSLNSRVPTGHIHTYIHTINPSERFGGDGRVSGCCQHKMQAGVARVLGDSLESSMRASLGTKIARINSNAFDRAETQSNCQRRPIWACRTHVHAHTPK